MLTGCVTWLMVRHLQSSQFYGNLSSVIGLASVLAVSVTAPLVDRFALEHYLVGLAAVFAGIVHTHEERRGVQSCLLQVSLQWHRCAFSRCPCGLVPWPSCWKLWWANS